MVGYNDLAQNGYNLNQYQDWFLAVLLKKKKSLMLEGSDMNIKMLQDGYMFLLHI